METKYGFLKLTPNEFKQYIANLKVARTIYRVQQHNTYIPDYSFFNGRNHFDLQKNMKNYHVYYKGWSDIGQQLTIFPDGTVVTGRNLEKTPAGIVGANPGAICIENFGYFDKGFDTMTSAQKDAIVQVTATLCHKFNLGVNTNSILYHHWFTSWGTRDNGSSNYKSCPGTNFFGGNKVTDCEKNFLPLIRNILNGSQNTNPNPNTILKYVSVTASSLNIRIGPNTKYSKTSDREAAVYGSILRVYAEEKGWLKISGSSDHWVYARYTEEVTRATVKASTLNVRNRPGIDGLKVGFVYKNDEVFVYEEKNNWCRITVGETWVSKKYLTF